MGRYAKRVFKKEDIISRVEWLKHRVRGKALKNPHRTLKSHEVLEIIDQAFEDLVKKEAKP